MERYQGKKVVTIGGTSGMGLATAKMFIDGGARVLVTGLSKAGLDSAEKEIGKHPRGNIVFYATITTGAERPRKGINMSQGAPAHGANSVIILGGRWVEEFLKNRVTALECGGQGRS
jgi:NAD(P)-dependent dehydrogenase (short-subunit alcohol dehydrogenase family)